MLVQATAEYIRGLGPGVLNDAVFLDAAKKVVEVAASHRLFQTADDLDAPVMAQECEGQQAVALLQYKALLLGDTVLGLRPISEEKQKVFKRMVGEFIGTTLKTMKKAGHTSDRADDVVPELGGFLDNLVHLWPQNMRPSCMYLEQDILDRSQRCDSVRSR